MVGANLAVRSSKRRDEHARLTPFLRFATRSAAMLFRFKLATFIAENAAPVVLAAVILRVIVYAEKLAPAALS